jgi:hypothetical protein
MSKLRGAASGLRRVDCRDNAAGSGKTLSVKRGVRSGGPGLLDRASAVAEIGRGLVRVALQT